VSDYTGLREASVTLQARLTQAFIADPQLNGLFTAQGFTVSLKSPKEMRTGNPPKKGLSVWLYQIERSAELTNRPTVRISPTELRRPPLPMNLHYLFTPIADRTETEQLILGKVLQVLNDGTTVEPDPARPELREALRISLETLDLESITRVWTALEAPYELCMSYLVHVVDIESGDQPALSAPVLERESNYGQLLAPVAP
jgi:Pvc16 N-terminal domain